MLEKKTIGTVVVVSGMLLLIDPANISHWQNGSLDRCAKMVYTRRQGGELKKEKGLALRAGISDSVCDVIATYKEKKLVKVEIKLV